LRYADVLRLHAHEQGGFDYQYVDRAFSTTMYFELTNFINDIEDIEI